MTDHQREVLAYIRAHPGCTLDQSQKNAAQPLIRARKIVRVMVNLRSTYYAIPEYTGA